MHMNDLGDALKRSAVWKNNRKGGILIRPCSGVII
uniref:Uncharacterized protein n=1 Tax=Calidris pygmaea TaxID=425635 RepID=A0A8C3KDY1_9CHAR